MERKAALTLIYRHTHKDFKSTPGMGKNILMYVTGKGTCLVALDSLTDAQIAEKLPYAERKEAERLAKIAAKKG